MSLQSFWGGDAHALTRIRPARFPTNGPQMSGLILASGSAARRQILRAARIPHTVEPARVDEVALKAALLEEAAPPRDIADALAEAKARKVGSKHPEAVVLGCDQVLEHDRELLTKPTDRDDAAAQLRRLSGSQHRLLSAVVAYEDGAPVWRYVGVVRLRMRPLSEAYITAYLDRNWPEISDAVGSYHLEGEGARLFQTIEGDYFTVLGLPLMELVSWLTLRGALEI